MTRLDILAYIEDECPEVITALGGIGHSTVLDGLLDLIERLIDEDEYVYQLEEEVESLEKDVRRLTKLLDAQQ